MLCGTRKCAVRTRRWLQSSPSNRQLRTCCKPRSYTDPRDESDAREQHTALLVDHHTAAHCTAPLDDQTSDHSAAPLEHHAAPQAASSLDEHPEDPPAASSLDEHPKDPPAAPMESHKAASLEHVNLHTATSSKHRTAAHTATLLKHQHSGASLQSDQLQPDIPSPVTVLESAQAAASETITVPGSWLPQGNVQCGSQEPSNASISGTHQPIPWHMFVNPPRHVSDTHQPATLQHHIPLSGGAQRSMPATSIHAPCKSKLSRLEHPAGIAKQSCPPRFKCTGPPVKRCRTEYLGNRWAKSMTAQWMHECFLSALQSSLRRCSQSAGVQHGALWRPIVPMYPILSNGRGIPTQQPAMSLSAKMQVLQSVLASPAQGPHTQVLQAAWGQPADLKDGHVQQAYTKHPGKLCDTQVLPSVLHPPAKLLDGPQLQFALHPPAYFQDTHVQKAPSLPPAILQDMQGLPSALTSPTKLPKTRKQAPGRGNVFEPYCGPEIPVVDDCPPECDSVRSLNTALDLPAPKATSRKQKLSAEHGVHLAAADDLDLCDSHVILQNMMA